jgi:hypothetical protein
MPPLLPLLLILSPTGQRGWLSIALLAAFIAIPYLNGALIRGRRQADNSPAPSPLWPHYWLALLLAVFSLWWPCLACAARAGHISPGLTNGLWLATIALVLLLLQLAVVGVVLRCWGPGSASMVLRTHFVLMAVIVLLLLAHIWPNSRFLHCLF